MKKSVAIFMALTLILSLSFFAAAETVESADASTMRLARAEGCVFLNDESGTELSYRENMRLYSGNTVATEADSRAGISLDETKIVTLDEQSFASLHQNGKKLRVKLENGAMYFSVSKPLASDEQFDIETSTMVLGIRGTSGYVEALSPTSSLVILTSGHAVITAVSGEEQEINPGQCVVIRLTSSGAEFIVSAVSPSGFPALLTEELAADPVIAQEVASQNKKAATSQNNDQTSPASGTSQVPGSQSSVSQSVQDAIEDAVSAAAGQSSAPNSPYDPTGRDQQSSTDGRENSNAAQAYQAAVDEAISAAQSALSEALNGFNFGF